jgi:hypothetical protein
MLVRKLFFNIATLGTIFFGAGAACAACVDNRHPPLQEERRASSAIIEGQALHAQPLMEDAAHPSAVTATLYEVHVLHTKKGRLADTIQVKSGSTSSHFPMDIGRSYLLFLKRDGDVYTVDNCGNSARIAETRRISSSNVPAKRIHPHQ